MLEVNWQAVVGILLVSLFSFMGMKFIDDKKLKMVAFGTGVTAASIFAGLDIENLFANGESYFSNHADVAGIATSTTAVLLSTLNPIKSLRNAGFIAGFTGIVTGLFGNPSWIGFVVWVAIITILGIIAYKLIQKALNSWKSKNDLSFDRNYYDHAN